MSSWLLGAIIFILLLAIIEETINFFWKKKVPFYDEKVVNKTATTDQNPQKDSSSPKDKEQSN